ncbi:hypothetical protein ACFZDI_29520 [Streptomyces sp. NPDC007907]|uniref:hypothetical protein n=1 Tax=Streptomyces sp. NPDC007907 TaxID=3364789 RepID=UPI0036E89D7D
MSEHEKVKDPLPKRPRGPHPLVIESVDLTRVEEPPAPRKLPRKGDARRRAMRIRGW